MIWQDIVLSVGVWIFVLALIPTLRSKDKPPMSTSLVTGAVMVVMTFTYFSLDLWSSTVSAAVLSVMWLTIGMQKYLNGKKPKSL